MALFNQKCSLRMPELAYVEDYAVPIMKEPLLLRARKELFHQQNELGENFGLYLHR